MTTVPEPSTWALMVLSFAEAEVGGDWQRMAQATTLARLARELAAGALEASFAAARNRVSLPAAMFSPVLIARAAALIARYQRGCSHGGDGGILHGGLIAKPANGDSRLFGVSSAASSSIRERGQAGSCSTFKLRTLARHGAVGEQTAVAMSRRARFALHAPRLISVTGIARPDGRATAKPVSLVR